MDAATGAEQHDDDEDVTDEASTPDEDASDEDEAVSPETESDPTDDEDDSDQFPRPYVERLRARSAGYRARAKAAAGRASEAETARFTERLRVLAVLVDPADLPYDADLLDDSAAPREAVTELVGKRPHLRRRGVAGRETGARETADTTEPASLLGIMRRGA